MAAEKEAAKVPSPPKTIEAVLEPLRKRKQQLQQQQRRRRPPSFPRKEEAGAEGEGPWGWEQGGEERGRGRGRGGRGRGRGRGRSRGGGRDGPRGRGGRGGGGGRPWREGGWGPLGMEEGPPADWEDDGGGGGPWWAPEGEGWGPGEWDERPPWPPAEEWEAAAGGGGPWEPPEMDPWAPLEMEEREGRGRRWRPPEGGRDRSWEGRGRSREPPERNGRGPPEREGRAPSPAREAWPHPPEEGLWRGPEAEMPHRSGPLSILGWEPQRAERRSRWEREEAGREGQAPPRGPRGPAKPWRDRSESPAAAAAERSHHPPEKMRRIRWDAPEGRGSQRVQDSPEGLRRHQDPNRGWREGSRDHGYPARHQLPPEAPGAGGQWSGPEEMQGEPPGPPRGEWGWDRPRWQAGEERDQYSPHWEEGRERFRGQSPPEQRGRGHPSQYDGELPHGQWHPEGPPASFQGECGPRGDRVDREAERDWKEEEGHGGGGGDDAEAFAEALAAGPVPVPKEWTPCEEVINYWARCRTVLKKKPRRCMMATCPRPTLPDRSSETPELNASILAMLKPNQQKEIAGASRSLRFLQDEVLDMLGPAMAIYEMAEEALQKGKPVDPMELREGARRVVRCIGSLNQTITLQRRVVVLGAIQPRLKCVTSKMSSLSTDGMLFAEDKVKLLKEIIKRFPQLAQNPQAPRRAQPFPRPSRSRRRAPVRSDRRHLHSAEKPYRRSPADQHEEEDH